MANAVFEWRGLNRGVLVFRLFRVRHFGVIRFGGRLGSRQLDDAAGSRTGSRNPISGERH